MAERAHGDGAAPTSAHPARDAGLRYSCDHERGILRKGRPGRFYHVHAHGRRVRAARILRRIQALAIPPAWTDVWICPDARGHVQATGRDARGRKQYRYHSGWRSHRDKTKFERLIDFARALPRIRKQTAADLALRGLPRDKVLALVVRLLEKSLIRVGNGYLRELCGTEFTAKDFRTWSATVLAIVALREYGPGKNVRQAESHARQAIEAVATILGNTPAVWLSVLRSGALP